MEGELTNREAINICEPDSALCDAVFSAMNPNLDDVDKVLYIYTKLCSLLSYDAEYWATECNDENNIPPKFLRHIDINEINKISPTNPEVVCVDFNILFAKMLEMNGIHTRIKTKGRDGENEPLFMYHTDVEVPLCTLKNPSPILNNINSNEPNNTLYLTFAGYYDMNNIKVLGEINNITLRGFSNEQKSFETELESKLKHTVSYEIGHSKQALKCLLSEYELQQKLANLVKSCSYPTDTEERIAAAQERFHLFFSKITQINMPTFPALLYSSKLFDQIISPLKNDNFVAEFSIIKEQKKDQKNMYDMVGLIALGPKRNVTYIHFSPNKFIQTIDKQLVQNNFAERKMDYISNLMPRARHLVPYIYSPYIELRYKRLFDDIEKNCKRGSDTPPPNYKDISCCTNELDSYFQKWHPPLTK
ncbi:MAG: hypothetical protein IKQ31_01055 [Clostridia bacterium]|nr:hypothetical protein [Clostridia bacterium]